MGSHEEGITAPEKGSRDASQIAPAWFLYVSRALFLGIEKAPEAKLYPGEWTARV